MPKDRDEKLSADRERWTAETLDPVVEKRPERLPPEQFSSVSSHVYELAGLDRAIAERATVGCVKVVIDRSGRILGGHILGHSAGTMIAEIALAMKHGIKIGSLSALVHPYPTMSEGVRRVADTYRKSLLTGWRKSVLDTAIKVGRIFPA